ncbi:helix-turn-helix domain-containing protein [Streptomyces fulvoviolaceus]|uniref:helix-turn-helix domain-containing protein n=1 Tax=Streptomyces fulvoviolaceus TaxID=285535 RepID=UPI0021BF299C|nr:helix-turn-helix transcriptional regulator [Streptomyces fulvoviolaceus]MCT9080272.1 helix-turn-helix domain-containing protein [Streptomyces fulvoviolaceus]
MSDARTSLAQACERLDDLTGRPGRLAEVLDVADLSYRTGISAETVAGLLAGESAPETDLSDRVRQRLDFVRESRRRPDGKRYSLDELARIAGTSRQWLSEWRRSGLPSLEHADRIRRFFDLPAGFFTADEAEALHTALQPVLRELEAKTDPLAPLRTPGFYRLARRAPHMSPRKLQALAEWAEMVTEKNSADDDDI